MVGSDTFNFISAKLKPYIVSDILLLPPLCHLIIAFPREYLYSGGRVKDFEIMTDGPGVYIFSYG